MQKGRAIKAQSFQSIEAIAVRDFDDKRIILIQVGCFFCFWSCWSNNTREKCCVQNIPKVEDQDRVEFLSC